MSIRLSIVKEHQVSVRDHPGRRSSSKRSSDDDIRGLVYCISITVESHLRTSPADALNSRKCDQSSVRDVTAQHENIVSKDARRDRGMLWTRPSFVHPTDLELDDREDPPEDPRERVTDYRADIGKMVSSQEKRVSYMTSRCKRVHKSTRSVNEADERRACLGDLTSQANKNTQKVSDGLDRHSWVLFFRFLGGHRIVRC